MNINDIEVRKSEDYPEYGTSYCGKVFRLSTKKEMKQPQRRGYPYINTSINGKARKVSVHIMVAKAWVHNDNPDLKKWVNHKDGNKSNNNADNLEWVTRSQNQRHAVESGLITKGSDKYNSVLTDCDVHRICSLLVDGLRVIDISKKVGVTKDLVTRIRLGDTFFHIRSLYPIDIEYRHNFSENTVKWICERIVDGYGDKEIVNLSSNKHLKIIDVKRIRYKIRYKSISDLYF